MKKKLIATLLACAVMSTGIIGFTACGNGLTVNKGEEVTEEEWAAAFTASLQAKNVTIDRYEEDEIKHNATGDGTKDWFGVDSVNITWKQTTTGKAYYDLENGAYYLKATYKGKVSGVPEKQQAFYTTKNYVEEHYTVKDGNRNYEAWYNRVVDRTPDNEWYASFTWGQAVTEVYVMEWLIMMHSTSYNDFTYSDGVYTSISDNTTVTVSIKGGYVVGYSSEYITTDEGEGYSYRRSKKMVYNFSDYGSTAVKPSNAAKKAVEDYKASHY